MTTPNSPHARRARRGLTVIELMVVLVILAGMFVGAVSMVNSLSRSKLKGQAMRMSGMIKYAYAQAAIRQRYYRLVINMESNEYWVEVAPNDRPGSPPTIPEVRYIGAPEQVDLPRRERTIGYEEGDAEGSVFGLQRPKYQQITDDPTIKRKSLTDGIRVVRVFTSQNEEGVEGGTVGITFFPNGFVEPTIIVLGAEDSGYMSLELEPLTGRVNVLSGQQDPSRDFFEPEEDK